MQHKEIADKFYEEMFRLSGWTYTPAAVNDRGMYLRAAAEKFIYQDLASQDMIISKAKSNRMALPPWLHYVLDVEGVEYQALIVLDAAKNCNTIEELEMALNKKSASSDEKADFDRLLSAFLFVPKD